MKQFWATVVIIVGSVLPIANAGEQVELTPESALATAKEFSENVIDLAKESPASRAEKQIQFFMDHFPGLQTIGPRVFNFRGENRTTIWKDWKDDWTSTSEHCRQAFTKAKILQFTDSRIVGFIHEGIEKMKELLSDGTASMMGVSREDIFTDNGSLVAEYNVVKIDADTGSIVVRVVPAPKLLFHSNFPTSKQKRYTLYLNIRKNKSGTALRVVNIANESIREHFLSDVDFRKWADVVVDKYIVDLTVSTLRGSLPSRYSPLNKRIKEDWGGVFNVCNVTELLLSSYRCKNHMKDIFTIEWIQSLGLSYKPEKGCDGREPEKSDFDYLDRRGDR